VLTIDIKPPSQLLALPELYRKTLGEIAEAVRNDLVSMAQNGLGPETSGEYVMGIQMLRYPLTTVKIMKGGYIKVAEITLTGELPNSLESGMGGYDMKPGLLKGRNAKDSKSAGGGRYNTVPFRHGTAKSTGHAGPPMGSAMAKAGMSRSEAEMLGKRINKAAKKLEASTTHATQNKTMWGQRLARRTGGVSKLKPHHKTDIYAGMVRMTKTYKKKTQSKYMTFRRVSTNSPGASWMHPGFTGKLFFPKAAKRAQHHARLIFSGAVRGLAKGFGGMS
jgi:hypothetical protein